MTFRSFRVWISRARISSTLSLTSQNVSASQRVTLPRLLLTSSHVHHLTSLKQYSTGEIYNCKEECVRIDFLWKCVINLQIKQKLFPLLHFLTRWRGAKSFETLRSNSTLLIWFFFCFQGLWLSSRSVERGSCPERAGIWRLCGAKN